MQIDELGYLERLRIRREEKLRQIAATPPPPTLHERIEAWFSTLPEPDQKRAWTMGEFRALFGESPQRIGAVLFELGWTRRRSWADDRPTARYWLKE